MQTRTRACPPGLAGLAGLACLACLACLAALPAAHAQACTNKFHNLTTCRMLNGVPAFGDTALIANTKTIESKLKLEYDADEKITKDAECLRLFEEFKCISYTNSPVFSAPCAADGTRLKPCYAMCVNIHKKCYKTSDLEIKFNCEIVSAPEGDAKCYGTAGVLGMQSAASLTAASWAVAPLALAVARLGMSSSF